MNRVSAGASVTFAVSERGHAALAAARNSLHEFTNVLGLDLGHGAAVSSGLAADLIQLLIEVRAEARRVDQ